MSTAESQAALTAAIVRLALTEDLGTGDVTTLATIPAETTARARVRAREAGVLSGLEVAAEVVRAVDPAVEMERLLSDGDRLTPGETVLVLEGAARSLLVLERVLLNFLQRLSGVASLTARYVEAVRGTGVAIADTRKTTPGLRWMEKAAVRHGGGVNYRFGLYDAVMIKDNHIAAAGGIGVAVERVRARRADLRLIVEARTPEEVEEAAGLLPDQILLDNMDPEQIRAAVEVIRRHEARAARDASSPAAVAQPSSGPHHIVIEVSGGVTLATVRARALPGVDLISVGALTHSAPACDLSMDLELRPRG